jgi:hypothetical protein
MGCQRDHWIGQAKIYDDGRRDEPAVHPVDQLADHGDLDDHSHYFPANPPVRPGGVLRITYWGHDPNAVLAAVTERYTAGR